MKIYRAILKQLSPSRTPWQADTLFGHLCWQMLYHEGETALNDFLDLYRQRQPPLLFSNGFPGDYLPRPYLPPPTKVGTTNL
jgi:CRISPR-associated protein Csm4